MGEPAISSHRLSHQNQAQEAARPKGSSSKTPATKVKSKANGTKASDISSNGEGPSGTRVTQETRPVPTISKGKERAQEANPRLPKRGDKDVERRPEEFPTESSTSSTPSSSEDCHFRDHHLIKDLESQISARERVEQELRTELDKKKADIESKDETINRLQDAILRNPSDSDSRKKLIECENLRDLCRQLRKDKKDLEERLEAAEAEIKTLKRRVQELQEELAIEKKRSQAEHNGLYIQSQTSSSTGPHSQGPTPNQVDAPLSPPSSPAESPSASTRSQTNETYLGRRTYHVCGRKGKILTKTYFISK
ncbi:hypothetical protein BKA65DRAFT_45636 [Rhexocercosporidium sp. MPI-PUGE-AT-0058]|nr:hypothetical protein BKA65DRAFT_45636 [Rhexocercosporidium sp. MPI-PUGE-AT-0058]